MIARFGDAAGGRHRGRRRAHPRPRRGGGRPAARRDARVARGRRARRAFLVTAVARVGSLDGPDVATVKRVVRSGRPVLAAGGIATSTICGRCATRARSARWWAAPRSREASTSAMRSARSREARALVAPFRPRDPSALDSRAHGLPHRPRRRRPARPRATPARRRRAAGARERPSAGAGLRRRALRGQRAGADRGGQARVAVRGRDRGRRRPRGAGVGLRRRRRGRDLGADRAAHFHGSLADLAAVRVAIDLPVLRKDFLVHPVAGDRGPGARSRRRAADHGDPHATTSSPRCWRRPRDLAMGALVETHTDGDLERALATDAEVIGVNARDLEIARGRRRSRPRATAAVSRPGGSRCWSRACPPEPTSRPPSRRARLPSWWARP